MVEKSTTGKGNIVNELVVESLHPNELMVVNLTELFPGFVSERVGLWTVENGMLFSLQLYEDIMPLCGFDKLIIFAVSFAQNAVIEKLAIGGKYTFTNLVIVEVQPLFPSTVSVIEYTPVFVKVLIGAGVFAAP